MMPPDGLPRLLHRTPQGLAEHMDRYGPVPFRGRTGRRGAGGHGEGLLVDSVERSGLTGRGGGEFPTARKMRAVLASSRGQLGDRGRAALVANGVESEPLSAKDRSLLTASPHLVLDGIALAAESVGAKAAFLCVDGGDDRLRRHLGGEIAARERAGIPSVPVHLTGIPAGYVASEESSLIHLLNGGRAVPTFVPPRPFSKGVGGRPTLVSNVETLAHIALIARYGPAWFRAIGTGPAPGSTLITIAGAVRVPQVREIALGTSMREVLAGAGGPTEPPQAILVGGYFGAWLPAAGALGLPVGPDLRAAGAPLGAGLLAVLPDSVCGLAETARIARYLAAESAGQCGPCVNGLPAIADALAQIAWRGRDNRVHHRLTQLAGLVDGRGACHLPSGVARLVASALRVFAADVRQHLRRGPCERARRRSVVVSPGGGPAGGTGGTAAAADSARAAR